jgi:hypothetical protein
MAISDGVSAQCRVLVDPRMIEKGKLTHIAAWFAPLHGGNGELESVYLIPESKIDEVWAI